MALPKGFKMTELTRQKMSESHKGLRLSAETKEKLRIQRLGWKMSEESKEKMKAAWCYKRHFTPETKRKLSESHKGQVCSLECRQKLSEALKGRTFCASHRQHISEARIGKRGHPHTEVHKKMMSRRLKGRVFSAEWRAKLSKAKDGMYLGPANPFWGKHHTQEAKIKILQNRHYPQPNGAEQELLQLLGSGWTYVGDGQLVLAGKCPDFWNSDHKLIELFGDYWHRGENPEVRIQHFKNEGYDCLVVWEHELQEKAAIKTKVCAFLEI